MWGSVTLLVGDALIATVHHICGFLFGALVGLIVGIEVVFSVEG